MQFLSCVIFATSLFATAYAANEDILSDEFCRQFPSLHLCRLHETLQGSLVELQYLLQDTEGQITAAAGTPMQKRKSAFVRFGKRSVEGESPVEMEKRKSAFVRFGRSLTDREAMDKRKSQYIRFGRK